MIKSWRIKIICWLFSLVFFSSPFALHSSPFALRPSPFAFVRPEVVITAEFDKESEIILNIINLGEAIVVFEAKNLIVKSATGKISIGQVINLPETDNKGDTWKYRATLLVSPKTSQGFSVLGAYRDMDRIETLVVHIGGRRYALEPLAEPQFNVLADKISNLDLQASNFAKLFQQADITNRGRLTFPSADEDPDAADLRGLLTPEGMNPPRVLNRRLPPPTAEAIKAGTQGAVRISGTVTRDGDFRDAKVVKGLGHGLDERALEAVKNSWKFLPATKDGQVVNTTITFEVEFNASRK